MISIYLSVLISTFLAATFVPVPSEVAVLAALSHDQTNVVLLWLIATTGNTLGAVLNWCLGRYSLRFQTRRWWPASPSQMQRAENWFSRYGIWSLLLAWVPIIGDPITLIAGVLRVRLPLFVCLVAVGKAARFALLLGLVGGLAST